MTLQNIDMVGNDLDARDGAGGCGKGGQMPLPTSGLHAHLSEFRTSSWEVASNGRRLRAFRGSQAELHRRILRSRGVGFRAGMFEGTSRKQSWPEYSKGYPVRQNGYFYRHKTRR